MPYLQTFHKDLIDTQLTVRNLAYRGKPGELNYFISRLIWWTFKLNPCYDTANMLVGVLESVKQEFYRRIVAPYEDKKMYDNGDITNFEGTIKND